MDVFSRVHGTQVNVGRFPPHGRKQSEFVTVGWRTSSSMREQWGDKRRTIQCPRNCTKGSGQRAARVMMAW